MKTPSPGSANLLGFSCPSQLNGNMVRESGGEQRFLLPWPGGPDPPCSQDEALGLNLLPGRPAVCTRDLPPEAGERASFPLLQAGDPAGSALVPAARAHTHLALTLLGLSVPFVKYD